MIRSLDHIAIAVTDLGAGVRRFAEDMGFDLEGIHDVPAAQTRTAFFPVSDPENPARLELVVPLEGGGPLVRHLERRGPGLHHICFRSDDLNGDMARLQAKGYRFTSEAPLEGAGGTRVLWIHPRSADGLLIELVEVRP